MSTHIIGIDLGTTNSEVAIWQDDQARILDVDGTRLVPSVVGLADDGSLLVGQTARNQLALHPERTIKSIKRRMGEDTLVSLGDKAYSPQEISALILGRLRRAAEEKLGEPVGRAVITVPAYFSDAQRQATRDAGELAGLEVVRIINEPTAAALAYEGDAGEAKTILVYDLGGGTFDVSVVRMEVGVTEVLASHGNNQLGGDDFDAAIVEHLLKHLREKQGVDPSADLAAMARLGRAAEAAKIALSDAPYAAIGEEYLTTDGDGQPLNLSLELDRLDYEVMIESYVDETLEAVHTALKDARLTVSDLDEVLLVGGATRTPLIQRRLQDTLGLAPRREVDPDLCVAAGAAIQAAIIGGNQVGGVLVDVTPYTFGTSAISELNGEMYPYTYIPLIHKNSPVPVTKSDAFSTTFDGQQAIEVRVYQGEDPDALNNTEIGSFMIEGLDDVAAGNIIITTFSLDLDGILHVSSVEKHTGLKKHIRIENATTRFKQQEMAAARERLDALMDAEVITVDTAGVQSNDHRREVIQAQALLEKAERAMQEASPDDKEDLVDMSEALRDALSAEDPAAVKAATDELSDLLFYLET